MKTELEKAIEFFTENRNEFEDALQAKGIIMDLWSIEDIKSIDDELTNEQIDNVLSMMRWKRDANIGINWETIQVWIDIAKDEF